MIKLIFARVNKITPVGVTNNDQVFLCPIILSHFLFSGVELRIVRDIFFLQFGQRLHKHMGKGANVGSSFASSFHGSDLRLRKRRDFSESTSASDSVG